MEPKHLLICVDDDPPVLSAIRRLLRHEPYEIITTVDPHEALACIGSRKVDLVIADQRMPAMAGTDLLKAVRERSPDTVGVILTGHADLSDVASAMNDGAVDRLIKKPWDDAGFRALIQTLLAERGDRGRRAEDPAPEDVEPPTVHPLDCAGRTVAQVLSDLSDLLHGPEGAPARAVVSFQDLMRLDGSVTVLLSEVLREIVRSGARAALIDGTGAAGTFLELVGGHVPVVVYQSSSEIAPPRHILIVEDQEDSLDFLRVLLESAGHTCEAVASVREATGRLRAGAFDLILLDLVLPDAEGVEVARHILDEGLKIPIIAVSGFLDRSRAGACAGLGIRKQVSKPYRAREILDAIRDS